ncbi:hypothetical protein ACIBJE_01565 [Micromonospora sp. NPDC050187]|uniref:hypothetical protein n=1 Tax=Micromonospora sp. NPDC050187 TaxID=3364277 RepID=UPI0037BC28B4
MNRSVDGRTSRRWFFRLGALLGLGVSGVLVARAADATSSGGAPRPDPVGALGDAPVAQVVRRHRQGEEGRAAGGLTESAQRPSSS